MLRQHPKYFNSKVVRSRDEKVLADLDIVIDVGSVYDHSKLRCKCKRNEKTMISITSCLNNVVHSTRR